MKTIKTIIVIIISIVCFIALFWFFLVDLDPIGMISGSCGGGMIIIMIAGCILDDSQCGSGSGGCECCGTPGCF